MENNYSEDIVPPRKSIKDIPLPARKRRVSKSVNPIKPPKEEIEPPTEIKENIDPENFSENYGTSGNRRMLWIILSAVIVVLLIIFFIFNSLDSATVKITPKSENISLNNSFIVENFIDGVNSDSLKYKTIEITSEVEKIVEAKDEELVQEKASGTIRVLNSYSEEEQRLIKNTRFESKEGKIYRIQDSIIVPGYTKNNDEIVPGQLDVVVYADEEGEEYNVNSTTFTIPGFEGQEPFDFFKAETVTSIDGGFDGIRKIISEESLENAKSDLTAALTNKLIDQAEDQITEEFILTYNNQSFLFESIDQEDLLTSDESKLRLKGKLYAKIFSKVDISNALAEQNISSYMKGDNVLINNFKDIKIDLIKDLESTEERLQINGNSEIVWVINEETLKEKLIGTPKNSLGEVVKGYNGISKVNGIIRPFWRNSFPNDVKDIKIEIIRE